MSSFGSVDFKVKPDSDGFFPNPARDTDGSIHYKADVVCLTNTDYERMQSAVTRGTLKPVAGFQVCNYHIEAGIGSRPLEVPLIRGVLKTYDTAILVSFTPSGSGVYPGPEEGFWQASAEWLIISTLIP